MRTGTMITRLSCRIAVIVVAFVAVGCTSTYPFYSGPRLPREQVAILKCRFNADPPVTVQLFVERIDDIRVCTFKPVELLPGSHKIVFELTSSATHDSVVKQVFLDPGKTYIASYKIHMPTFQTVPGYYSGTWSVNICEE